MTPKQTELEQMINEFIRNHCIFTSDTHPMRTAFIDDLKAILDKACKRQKAIDRGVYSANRYKSSQEIKRAISQAPQPETGL